MKKLIDIALCVAVVNGVPVKCSDLDTCSECKFVGSADCEEHFYEWADAVVDDPMGCKTPDINVLDEPMTNKTINLADLKDAFIQTVNDVISGGGSTGDEKLDMATLYGVWSMYTNIIAKAESEDG